MPSSAAPVTESERIGSIDVLRGFAVLGILVMNIQSFAMPFSAYFNPTAYGDLSGANYWVWFFSHLLADQKFMTLFSLLFGAGVVLMSSRIEAQGHRAGPIYYRRTFWLLVFGLLHAYLIWYGDILVLYAVCGSVMFLMRRQPARRLLMIGLLVIAVGSVISVFFGWSMRFWPPEEIEKFSRDMWLPPAEDLAAEVAAYRGGWLDQMSHRVKWAFDFHSFVIWIWGIWRAGGLMLVGMALYKWGVFEARRSSAFYWKLAILGLATGIPTILYGIYRNQASNWDVRYSFFFGGQYNYWGSLPVSLAYVGLVMLACKSPALERLRRPFAAAGRMAFTCYLGESLICTTIFYGHGLGLFGSVDRLGQILITFAVYSFLLIFSTLWLRRFRYGPFEWVWRSLTYWKWEPMRRRAPLPVEA
jgi:uncharacterized protein